MKPSDIDEVILVGGSTRIPSIQKIVKDYFGKDPSKGVNPDEVVALGCSYTRRCAYRRCKRCVCYWMLRLYHLGIETMGGVMTKLIEVKYYNSY